MTGLLRLLTAILGAHIERDDLPPAELVWPDERSEVLVERIDFGAAVERERHYAQLANAMHAEIARQAAITRPCWACGDPKGFHVRHWPCWSVAPFTRNPPMPWVRQSDGSLM